MAGGEKNSSRHLEGEEGEDWDGEDWDGDTYIDSRTLVWHFRCIACPHDDTAEARRVGQIRNSGISKGNVQRKSMRQ